MDKDYSEWNKKKKELNSLKTRPDFHSRDIWLCHLGLNIGDEQDGLANDDFIRPVVIVRKFNSNLCSVIPLTRTVKDSPYYFQFSFIENEISSAILSQHRPIDSKRLRKKIGFISKGNFRQLTEKLKALIP